MAVMQEAWLSRRQQQRFSQMGAGQHTCARCGRSYKFLPSLRNHQKLECGMEPQFACPYCIYRAKRKHHLDSHLRTQHPNNA
ncbi:longitudinals lacking protein, isoforms A/B/D/L [Frankliniella occidentalis]|uniref:Longitudinals lacking protein, isoforms A/B/D/L n=1 Tax=Frankliniella occidentalis TaxID=133901 RepID=A0A6J1TI07_FRAOC|nr:longitudinals lacking protein, isoforms A/B/D/L [Frankliniella occidentalis]